MVSFFASTTLNFSRSISFSKFDIVLCQLLINHNSALVFMKTFIVKNVFLQSAGHPLFYPGISIPMAFLF